MSDSINIPSSRTGRDALAVAAQAAREAGEIQREYYFKDIHVEKKGNRNLVTEVDLLSEKIILSTIQDEFPDHSILSEESGNTETTSDYQWIIDPLDGTTNYTFGIPIFCASIGLICNDEILLGAVYDPMRDEMFQARKGGGSFLNQDPISVSNDRNVQTTLIGFDIGYDDKRTREMLSRANSVWTPEMAFRLIGSAALGMTYVACGRLDIYFHRSIYPWDIAGAMLLLREAGGEVVDLDGKPADVWGKSIIASSNLGEQKLLIDALK